MFSYICFLTLVGIAETLIFSQQEEQKRVLEPTPLLSSRLCVCAVQLRKKGKLTFRLFFSLFPMASNRQGRKSWNNWNALTAGRWIPRGTDTVPSRIANFQKIFQPFVKSVHVVSVWFWLADRGWTMEIRTIEVGTVSSRLPSIIFWGWKIEICFSYFECVDFPIELNEWLLAGGPEPYRVPITFCG